MKKKTDIQILSQTDNLRLYVIEHTIHIEMLISELIADLLNINLETSKSIGFSSAAISFSKKVQVLQDFNGIDPKLKNKLTCLMNIRNKFAHVQYVDSFENLFQKTANGEDLKKELDKWYSLEEKDDNDEEYKYKFFKLSEELTKLLFSLRINAKIERSKYDTERELKDNYLTLLKEEVLKLENGNDLIVAVIDKAEKILKNKISEL
jgi:hypothetical protein